MQENHHVENIMAKMKALRGKVSELERAAAQRKAKLDENSAFLQFNWKADVVESWIGEMPSLKNACFWDKCQANDLKSWFPVLFLWDL